MALNTGSDGGTGSGGGAGGGLESGDARNKVGLWVAIGLGILVLGGGIIFFFVK